MAGKLYDAYLSGQDERDLPRDRCYAGNLYVLRADGVLDAHQNTLITRAPTALCPICDANHAALIAALLNEQRIGAELTELRRPVDLPEPTLPNRTLRPGPQVLRGTCGEPARRFPHNRQSPDPVSLCGRPSAVYAPDCSLRGGRPTHRRSSVEPAPRQSRPGKGSGRTARFPHPERPARSYRAARRAVPRRAPSPPSSYSESRRSAKAPSSLVPWRYARASRRGSAADAPSSCA